MSGSQHRGPGDVPVITEADLQVERWTCAYCHEQTHGPDCTHCGSPRQDALIVVPDGEIGEELMERITTDKRCGHCKHFSQRKGQDALHNDRDPIFHKMVNEMEMRSVATNMDWKQAGVCEQWSGAGDDLFITCANAPARCAKKHLGLARSHKEKDHNVPCPAYDPRGSDGKVIRSYRQVKGSRTVGTE